MLLEEKRKFPMFPSFRFCPIPKIENSEISESFVLLQIFDSSCNLRCKNHKKLSETKS